MSLAEMQAQLGAFVNDYAQSYLRPLEPPPYTADSGKFRGLLSLWCKRCIEMPAVEGPSSQGTSSTAVSEVPSPDECAVTLKDLQNITPPDMKHAMLIKHVLSHVITSEAVQ
eukprot:Blabericola_migrator_1__4669@NODE_246_length_10907_cov_93_324631_g208_i0_p7_GENE_NODE_246_length_10907_cov_93_324631_g208_i0NODE_246_length_10907_cov_93_324631_g208_i0_p7_ORF_typecomplete_len112_score18_93_NODE_246_length_10907_cov_93_324631_g208_i01033910674